MTSTRTVRNAAKGSTVGPPVGRIPATKQPRTTRARSAASSELNSAITPSKRTGSDSKTSKRPKTYKNVMVVCHGCRGLTFCGTVKGKPTCNDCIAEEYYARAYRRYNETLLKLGKDAYWTKWWLSQLNIYRAQIERRVKYED